MNCQVILASAAIAALGAVLVSPSLAHADVDTTEIYLGKVKERPQHPGQMLYSGDFEHLFSSSQVPGTTKTLIDIDLASVIDSLPEYNAISGIRISDGGGNGYGQHSPGADIDFFALSLGGNQNNLIPTFSYDGPNVVHSGESSELLAQRVGEIDATGGVNDSQGFLHVSLGEGGSLTGSFDSPIFGTDGPTLSLVEAGSPEWSKIYVTLINAPIPAPGALAVFGLGMLRSRRRRA